MNEKGINVIRDHIKIEILKYLLYCVYNVHVAFYMCSWGKSIVGRILSFLELNYGDNCVGLVCKKWNEYEVACSILKLCNKCDGVVLDNVKKVCSSEKIIMNVGMLECLSRVKSLMVLDLGFGLGQKWKVYDGFISVLLGCNNLRVLRVFEWDVYECELYKLGGLVNLRELDLEGCDSVNDNVLRFLGSRLRKLRRLNIKSCINVGKGGICNEVWSCQMKMLESLDISYCKIDGDECGRILCELVELVELNMKGCNVTFDCMRGIMKLVGLRRLDFESCENIDDEKVAILRGLKKLSMLNLNCTDVTNKSIDTLKELGGLCELYMMNNDMDMCLMNFDIMMMKRMKRIHMIWWNDVSFALCGLNLENLKVLELFLRDDFVNDSLEGLVGLRELILYGEMTNDNVLNSVTIELEKLNVSCEWINTRVLSRFVNLHELYLNDEKIDGGNLRKLLGRDVGI